MKSRSSNVIGRLSVLNQTTEPMKLTRVRLTIEPWHLQDDFYELRVEAIVDGVSHNYVYPFTEDEFQSRFDSIMEMAREEILRLVKT